MLSSGAVAFDAFLTIDFVGDISLTTLGVPDRTTLPNSSVCGGARQQNDRQDRQNV